MSVTDQITNAASSTAQYQASQPRATGSASKLDSQAFMNLLMKQLQYQDPMEPVSNTDFIAQQAQFSQLSTTQDMSSNIASSNSASQAMSLVGKSVTLTDPDNKGKTITGTVEASTINGTKSTIKVNGKDYSMSYLKTVNTSTAAASTSTGTTATTAATTATDITTLGKSLIEDITALPALFAKELKTVLTGSSASTGTKSDTSTSST